MNQSATTEAPVTKVPATPRRDPKTKTGTRPKRQPPYVIVLENDNKHSFTYVIEVLRRICGHSESKASLLSNQIHNTGRAVVWTGTFELAELKRDQIRGFGPDFYASQTVRFPLGVTIEPLPSD